MRKADIFLHERIAGQLEELEDCYRFKYLPDYLADSKALPVILGIHPAVLPALAEEGILHPAAEYAVAAAKKYVLKEVILLRGKTHLLRKVREIEVAWTAQKNAKGKRVREKAEPHHPELS